MGRAVKPLDMFRQEESLLFNENNFSLVTNKPYKLALLIFALFSKFSILSSDEWSPVRLRRKPFDISKELFHFETMGKWNITLEESELDGGHDCSTLTPCYIKKKWLMYKNTPYFIIQTPQFFTATAGCISVNGEKWKVMVFNCVLG